MKRREAVRLIPLSFAGLSALPTGLPAETGTSLSLQDGAQEPRSFQYLKKVTAMLRRIRETQSENILAASNTVTRTIRNKRTCWLIWDMGHSASAELYPGRNGYPEVFTYWYDPEKARKGDMLLCDLPEYPPIDDIVKKEIVLIGGPAPWGGDAQGSELLQHRIAKMRLRPYSHIWIENYITTYGGIIYFPGMPAPLGPVSGVLGMVTLWMILADACRELAQEGISAPVRGDEPALKGDGVPWVSLHDPLMDNYFDEVLRQIEMVGAEYGYICQAARLAVDAVLAGGKVFCYDRYGEFASEASYRRSGLTLTRGISDNNGELKFNFAGDAFSSHDCVIMGISKPDDEVDLRYLDMFRKAGAKVVSMGPMMRDSKVQSGRTVPGEADVHIGRMCDTYGMFAIPGFAQKVCPTSGVLLNQIFWATCMEIAEEIVRRTGNVPGILFSAALKFGYPHDTRMFEEYGKRGY